MNETFRILELEEEIKPGDEFLPFGCIDSWFPVNDAIGRTVQQQLSRKETNQSEKFRRRIQS